MISETGAYEGFLPSLWPLLPVSAVTGMAAVTAFAANLFLTFGSRRRTPGRTLSRPGAEGHRARRVGSSPEE